jgi:hypothetical protein
MEMVTVTSKGTAAVTLPTDTQILITREFEAPRHLVYKAGTTPELIKAWWDPLRQQVGEIAGQVSSPCVSRDTLSRESLGLDAIPFS